MARNGIYHFLWFSTFTLFLCCAAKADDVWFVDSRAAYVTPEGRVEMLSVEKLVDNTGHWEHFGLNEFVETYDPSKPIIVMIHGNRMTQSEARQYGLAFHRFAKKKGDYRLVIWCWPSERRHCRVRPDVQQKAIRSEQHGPFVAAFLKEIGLSKPNSRVSILGFSYGARVTCSALDLLAKDKDYYDSETGTTRLKIQTVLLAAAMDCNSLMPSRSYGKALDVTEKMLVHINPDDDILRYYPLLWKLCGGSQAVGKKGVAMAGISRENRRKIKTVNVSRLLGEDHAIIKSLFGFLALDRDFRHYALFE